MLYPRYADIPHEYLGLALRMCGESDPRKLEAFMSSAGEILSRFDAIEEKIGEALGLGWVSIARLAYNMAVIDFARRIPARSRLTLLYERGSSKDEMTRAFLEPSLVGEATAGAISVAPIRNERLNNMLYAELRGVEKSQAMKHLNRWVGTVHSSNKSTEPTRILGEEHTWFFENDFADEILWAEKNMGHALRDNLTRMCIYNILKPRQEYLKQVIVSHSHVILADVHRIYLAPGQV